MHNPRFEEMVSNTSLVIEVCQVAYGSNTTPDTMQVSIGYNDSLCERSALPTSQPSFFKTHIPTHPFKSSSLMPSLSETSSPPSSKHARSEPTSEPTPVKAIITPTIQHEPTAALKAPTLTPISIPGLHIYSRNPAAQISNTPTIRRDHSGPFHPTQTFPQDPNNQATAAPSVRSMRIPRNDPPTLVPNSQQYPFLMSTPTLSPNTPSNPVPITPPAPMPIIPRHTPMPSHAPVPEPPLLPHTLPTMKPSERQNFPIIRSPTQLPSSTTITPPSGVSSGGILYPSTTPLIGNNLEPRVPSLHPSLSATVSPTKVPIHEPTLLPHTLPTMKPSDRQNFPITRSPTQLPSLTTISPPSDVSSGGMLYPSTVPLNGNYLEPLVPSHFPTLSTTLSPTLVPIVIGGGGIYIKTAAPTAYAASSIGPTISPAVTGIQGGTFKPTSAPTAISIDYPKIAASTGTVTGSKSSVNLAAIITASFAATLLLLCLLIALGCCPQSCSGGKCRRKGQKDADHDSSLLRMQLFPMRGYDTNSFRDDSKSLDFRSIKDRPQNGETPAPTRAYMSRQRVDTLSTFSDSFDLGYNPTLKVETGDDYQPLPNLDPLYQQDSWMTSCVAPRVEPCAEMQVQKDYEGDIIDHIIRRNSIKERERSGTLPVHQDMSINHNDTDCMADMWDATCDAADSWEIWLGESMFHTLPPSGAARGNTSALNDSYDRGSGKSPIFPSTSQVIAGSTLCEYPDSIVL